MEKIAVKQKFNHLIRVNVGSLIVAYSLLKELKDALKETNLISERE